MYRKLISTEEQKNLFERAGMEVKMNLPEDFKKRMQSMLLDEYDVFLQSYEGKTYRSLRMNPLKGDTKEGVKKLPFDLTPVGWEENGYYYGEDSKAGKHPYHDAGVYYIQEASAMVPVVLLEPEPGERILDLCAAPGGKSTQIAAYMRGEGILISNEIHPARAKILSENIERMGIANAIVTNETPQRLAETFFEYFDAVLVDAPCSGEGMFRKNEEACGEWSLDNVRLCADRQDEILDCAAKMVRPGGRIVYSTCTFAPLENEGSISRFLKKHTDFTVCEPSVKTEGMEGGVPKWQEDAAEGIDKTLRLWPHKIKGEGHFAAVLLREGADRSFDVIRKSIPVQRGISEREYREFLDFKKDYLTLQREGIYLKFGDQLYLAPEETPELRGLKVLRPGLHLGTFKKNRFEPSHALALSLSPGEAKCRYDFSSEGEGIHAYLTGHTFPAEGEKGWYLITVDSYSIGWGKLTGNIMKNHYPRGLRKL